MKSPKPITPPRSRPYGDLSLVDFFDLPPVCRHQPGRKPECDRCIREAHRESRP